MRGSRWREQTEKVEFSTFSSKTLCKETENICNRRQSVIWRKDTNYSTHTDVSYPPHTDISYSPHTDISYSPHTDINFRPIDVNYSYSTQSSINRPTHQLFDPLINYSDHQTSLIKLQLYGKTMDEWKQIEVHISNSSDTSEAWIFT